MWIKFIKPRVLLASLVKKKQATERINTYIFCSCLFSSEPNEAKYATSNHTNIDFEISQAKTKKSCSKSIINALNKSTT